MADSAADEAGFDSPKRSLLNGVHAYATEIESMATRIRILDGSRRDLQEQIVQYSSEGRERRTDRESLRVMLEAAKARSANLQKERERLSKRKQDTLGNLDAAEKEASEIQFRQRSIRRSRFRDMIRIAESGNETAHLHVRELDIRVDSMTAGNKALMEQVRRAQEKMKSRTAQKEPDTSAYPDMPDIGRTACFAAIATEKNSLDLLNERLQKNLKLVEELRSNV